MHIRSLSTLALSVLIGLLSACLYQESKTLPFGPDVKASMVIYFKGGVTEDQISEFWNQVLSSPDPRGHGQHMPLPGIGEIGRVYPPVQGHEAVSVTFFNEATQAEQRTVEDAVRSSPLVYKVLKNVAPRDVVSLD